MNMIEVKCVRMAKATTHQRRYGFVCTLYSSGSEGKHAILNICMCTSVCGLKQVHEGSRSAAHTMGKSKPEVALLLMDMSMAIRQALEW
jgi:hypothetical protein